MELSKEITTKLYNELMTQEVTKLLNIKREEVARQARIEVEKVTNTKATKAYIKELVQAMKINHEKNIKKSLADFFQDDICWGEIVGNWFDSDEGCEFLESMVINALKKGIK